MQWIENEQECQQFWPHYMHKTLPSLMLSDVPREFSSAVRYHDGHEQRYNVQFYVLSFHTESYPKSLRFVLTLTYCSNRYRTDIDIDIDYTVWTKDQILSHAQRRCGQIRPDLKTKLDLHAVWTKAFCWRDLRGFESCLTSPAEVRHSGQVSPWWRKANDAGQLSTEETLSLCVRVLQMSPPKKQGSELSWSGFYTHVWN